MVIIENISNAYERFIPNWKQALTIGVAETRWMILIGQEAFTTKVYMPVLGNQQIQLKRRHSLNSYPFH